MGIKAKPPYPLNSTHEKDQVTHHPWNLVRGLTHLPLPFPHPFLNTYHLLKNTILKISNHPKIKRWGEIFRETSFPPSNSQASLHLPLLLVRLTWSGGGGAATKLSRTEKSQGKRQERVSRGGDRAGQRGEREPGQSEGKEVQAGMKERWAALGRPGRGNRPGMRLGSRGQRIAAPGGGRGAVGSGRTATPAAGCFC